MDYLIIGLGNPNKEYESTRHNLGFIALKYLAYKLNIDFNKTKFKSLYSNYKNANIKNQFVLIKPQTFMNLSGESVREWQNFYKIKTEKIIVIHDDLDLKFGHLKIKLGGTSGGHNGIKNIIQNIQNKNFVHIKIGIGRAFSSDTRNYVLGNLNKYEKVILEKTIKKIYEIIDFYVLQNNSLSKTMSKYNTKQEKI